MTSQTGPGPSGRPATSAHDERFRRLYADEAQARLDRLGTGALRLGNGGNASATAGEALEELVRDAHTLKGGALVVGFPHIGRVARVVEERLRGLDGSDLRTPPGLPEALTTAAEGLRDLIARAMHDGHDDEAGADALAAQVAAALAEPAPPSPDAAGEPLEPAQAAAVVLVADDSAGVRAGLREQLSAQQLQVVVAADGIEAMRHATTRRPDLVLLDVDLSGIDGHEVLRRLKADPELADVPVVFLTARTGTADIVEGLRLGAHDYLPKPFEPAELTARVRAALRVKALQDQLRDLGRVDGLTGVANRRHLDEQLRALCSAAFRHRRPIAVALFDLDHFKSVNDRFGHPAGDRALRAAAGGLRDGLRAEDVVGRWGGEEFLAVLPSTDLDGAVVISERLRAAVAATPVVVGMGVSLTLTCSVGCAAWDGRGRGEPERLVALADDALYQAKSQGRDRVVAATGP